MTASTRTKRLSIGEFAGSGKYLIGMSLLLNNAVHPSTEAPETVYTITVAQEGEAVFYVETELNPLMINWQSQLRMDILSATCRLID